MYDVEADQTVTSTEDFVLISPAFSAFTGIPKRYTCEGDDISPPLFWKNAPPETKSFVLIVDDPDAPDPQAPKRVWVHWVLYNIPPNVTLLAEGVKDLPTGTQVGLNDWKKAEYCGPCPPIGEHRYFFKIYALDAVLDVGANATKNAVENAMEKHILANSEIVGTYKKSQLVSDETDIIL